MRYRIPSASELKMKLEYLTGYMQGLTTPNILINEGKNPAKVAVKVIQKYAEDASTRNSQKEAHFDMLAGYGYAEALYSLSMLLDMGFPSVSASEFFPYSDPLGALTAEYGTDLMASVRIIKRVKNFGDKLYKSVEELLISGEKLVQSKENREKARSSLIKIGEDSKTVMEKVYEIRILFGAFSYAMTTGEGEIANNYKKELRGHLKEAEERVESIMDGVHLLYRSLV